MNNLLWVKATKETPLEYFNRVIAKQTVTILGEEVEKYNDYGEWVTEGLANGVLRLEKPLGVYVTGIEEYVDPDGNVGLTDDNAQLNAYEHLWPTSFDKEVRIKVNEERWTNFISCAKLNGLDKNQMIDVLITRLLLETLKK
jgi:hypothetical protein